MTPTESQNHGQPFPSSSLIQMLMVLTMLGIVFAFWVAPPSASDSSANRVIEFAHHEPIVAIFDEGILRVIHAESGETLYRGAAALPKDSARQLQRPWHRWPVSWMTGEPAVRGGIDDPVIEFWSDDKALSLVGGNWKPDQPSTIVHWPTQNSKSLANDQGMAQTTTRLVQIDEFVVAVRMPSYSLGAFNFTPANSDALPTQAQYEVLWACNPATLATDVTEAQKKRAIEYFFVGRRDPFKLSRPRVRMQSKTLEGRADGIEITWDAHHVSDCWPTGDGNMICGFERSFFASDGKAQAGYWLVNEVKQKAQRVHWPFHEGDVINDAYGLKEHPLVIADLVTPAAGRIGVTSNRIAWNVATGKVIHVPSGAREVKPFGARLLVGDENSVWWLDLESGRRTTVVKLNSLGQYSKHAMVGIWIVLWLCLVRPMREGDLTRRFGVALMLLLTASLSMGQLDPICFFQNWPAMEWVSCASPFLPIAGLLWAGWSRRCVSGFMLTSSLGIALLLLSSLFVAGQTHDAALSALGGGNASVRDALWMQLHEPGALMSAPADPACTSAGWFGLDPEYRVDLISEVASERVP